MVVKTAVLKVIKFCKRVKVALVKHFPEKVKTLSLDKNLNVLAPKGD